MSRTYRRKDKIEYKWVLRDYINSDIELPWYRHWIKIDPKSLEGKKRLAQHHSDAGYCWQNYKGPHWFHNLFEERPRRRKAKRELHKFMKDPDYEVMLEKKKPVIYWL